MWQPIETAPTSGAILLFSAVHQETWLGTFVSNSRTGEEYWSVAGQANGCTHCLTGGGAEAFPLLVDDPTHWRPLPDPPA